MFIPPPASDYLTPKPSNIRRENYKTMAEYITALYKEIDSEVWDKTEQNGDNSFEKGA